MCVGGRMCTAWPWRWELICVGRGETGREDLLSPSPSFGFPTLRINAIPAFFSSLFPSILKHTHTCTCRCKCVRNFKLTTLMREISTRQEIRAHITAYCGNCVYLQLVTNQISPPLCLICLNIWTKADIIKCIHAVFWEHLDWWAKLWELVPLRTCKNESLQCLNFFQQWKTGSVSLFVIVIPFIPHRCSQRDNLLVWSLSHASNALR